MPFENHTIDNTPNNSFYSNREEITIWNMSTTINLTVLSGQKSFIILPLDSYTDGFSNNFLFKLQSAGADIEVQIARTIPVNREKSGSW